MEEEAEGEEEDNEGEGNGDFKVHKVETFFRIWVAEACQSTRISWVLEHIHARYSPTLKLWPSSSN